MYKHIHHILFYLFLSTKLFCQNDSENTWSPTAKALLEQAKNGTPIAQLILGEMLLTGSAIQNVQKDVAAASLWLKKASDHDLPKAKVLLGQLLLSGDEITRDEQEGIRLIRASADSGNALGKFALGKAYDQGNGVIKDPEKAIRLYKAAATAGNKDAQFMLSQCYKEGRLVKENSKESIKWLELAEKQGHPEASDILNRMREDAQKQAINRLEIKNRSDFLARHNIPQNQTTAVGNIIINSTAKWSHKLTHIDGGRYRINEGAEGDEIFRDIASTLSKGEYRRHFETGINLHKWILGLDGSTTSQALTKLSALVGKYYIIKGDLYQIEYNRDYPRDGNRKFTMFGGERYNENTISFVTFVCHSKTKVPPYRRAPAIVRFSGFHLGKNVSGKTIIVPEVEVVWMFSVSPNTKNIGNSELIINY